MFARWHAALKDVSPHNNAKRFKLSICRGVIFVDILERAGHETRMNIQMRKKGSIFWADFINEFLQKVIRTKL